NSLERPSHRASNPENKFQQLNHLLQQQRNNNNSNEMMTAFSSVLLSPQRNSLPPPQQQQPYLSLRHRPQDAIIETQQQHEYELSLRSELESAKIRISTLA